MSPNSQSPNPPLPDELGGLVSVFFKSPDELARFRRADADDMPEDYRWLLAHEHHMTLTVEAFHSGPVNVGVLRVEQRGQHYAREIILTRQSDGVPVQYGIMRVNFAYLGDQVRREIEARQTPLGRILIKHGVLRRIKLLTLWEVTPGPRLKETLNLDSNEPVYGRTALILCNEEPAIELLEIVGAV